MKKMLLIAAMMLSTAGFTNAFGGAVATAADGDFFVGKWEITMFDAPGGNITSVVTISRVEDKFEAVYGENKCSRVELENENTMTLYFESQGYDVYVVIEKSGDDTVKGVAIDMFDVTGKRLKE